MARFYDDVGFAQVNVETAPGVWEDVIIERKFFGDVLRNTRKLDTGAQVNNDISVGNSISIMADDDAFAHFFNMRYVKWMGTRWIVSDVEVAPPRLILRLGGVYNGPTPTT
ncbi:hypothetical protein SEA_MAKAI_15 [Arthrobacter phage Makai]|nr:hypothetical protein SEA_MAKAI_15 [Arthrobacter phage Makai]QPX62478.1 hypothetical protein SEA_TRUCKEE_14 [Arthrobacter phage Truckee]